MLIRISPEPKPGKSKHTNFPLFADALHSRNTLFLQDPFQLSAAIHDAITPLQEECERRGLSIEVTENPQGTPLTVLGDRSKVKQIISNVLANAVKHTETGGIAIEWGELTDGDIEDALDNKKDSIRIGISMYVVAVHEQNSRSDVDFLQH